MRLIKQSTSVRALVFLMVDSSDHITGKTGLAPTVTLSKNGATFTAPSGAVSEIGNGLYKVAGNTTDSNTLGSLILHATATGADPVDVEFEVVAFDPQDSVRMGQTALPNVAAGALNGLPLSADTVGRVDVLKINGTSQTARDIGASVLLSSGTGTGQVNLALGRVGINWGDVTNQATTVALTNTSISSVSGSVGSVTGAVGSVTGAVGSVTGNVGGNVTGSVGSVSNPASIWNALTSGLTTVGSVGKLLVDNINATISSRSSHTAADVWSVATRTLTSFGTLASDVWAVATRTLTAGTNIVLAKGTGVTGFNDLSQADVRSAVGLASANLDTQLDALPTALENADQVWNEAVADHLTIGSTGKKLNDLSTSGDPWSTAVPGSYSAGTAGYILGTNLDATVSSRLATSSISLSSGAVTVGSINNNAITAASIATDAIDGDALAASAVAEIQSGLSTLTTGQVENAVWDAALSSHTTAGTYGGRIPRSDSSNVEVKLTGSAHIAADIHELQPAVIDNTHFAAGAIDSNALATNAAQEIADAVLGRNIAGGSSTGRTVTEALRFLRNKFAVVGTTLTVYQEDDATVSWTATVGTTSGADPITSSDPA